MRRWRTWLVLGLLLSLARCTCAQPWTDGPADKSACDPQSPNFQQHPDARALAAMLAKEAAGIQACLQLSWGTGSPSASRTQLVWLGQDGSLSAGDDKSAPPALILPREANGQPLRFRVFAFSSNYKGKQELYCEGQMKSAFYDCLSPQEQGTCLGFFEFKPRTTSEHKTHPIYNDPDASCKLHLRVHTQPERTPDASLPEEPQPEPPEQQPEPRPEPRPETRPEPPPELLPELPLESPPEPPPLCQGAGCRWLQVAGGKGEDEIHGLYHADNGDIYVAGVLSSGADFGSLPTPKAYGGTDVFVAKMDRRGDWQWVRTAGSAKDDGAWAMATDKQGNLYIGGYFEDAATFGTIALDAPVQDRGPRDMFIAKLDTKGNWQWAIRSQGQGRDQVTSLAVGPQGNLYMGGTFYLKLIIDKTYQRPYHATHVLGKISPDGKWLWSTYYNTGEPILSKLAAKSNGPIIAVHPDQGGTLFVVGRIGQKGSVGPYNLIGHGDRDMFVGKIDKDGKWLSVYQSTCSETDIASNVTIAPNGHILVAGYYRGELPLNPLKLTSNQQKTGFIAAMDLNNKWQWAIDVRSARCKPTAIDADAQGNVYVLGTFQQNCQLGTHKLTTKRTAIFAAKLNAARQWEWAIVGGGHYPNQPIDGDAGFAIQGNALGDLAFVGAIFLPTFGKYTATTNHQDLQFFVGKNIHQ